jgi:hypothetical protein
MPFGLPDRPELMDAKRFGKLLAYACGDMRDWPTRCAWCRSTNVTPDLHGSGNVLVCLECRHHTTAMVAMDAREDDAREDLGLTEQSAKMFRSAAGSG